jgi:hypothetical protein
MEASKEKENAASFNTEIRPMASVSHAPLA